MTMGGVLRQDLNQVTCRLDQSRNGGKLDSGNLSKKALSARELDL